MRHLIVGTAGHIDHGKSALVRRLTGTDPDRLKDEKTRGITIDLGFADLDLGDGRIVSFVDVPGHERFVRHMVAGAAGIDAVVLVVAADEGVKPQTREHVDICRLLDVKHGLTVLTKTDLVEDELVSVVALEVQEFLDGTFLAEAPVVPVSAREGRGLAQLRTAMAALFDSVPERAATGVARLPIDRSFVMKGFGTVVTGSLGSGFLREGGEVEIVPEGVRGRIRGLQVHGRRVGEAHAGQRTAVNLQGLSCEQAPRGSTLVAGGGLPATRQIWARVDLLPGAPEKLARGGTLRFHQGTCARRARLRVVERRADGSLATILFFDRPAVLSPGDRFILRRPAPVNTVGGGVVLDAMPPRGRPDPAVLRLLEMADPEQALLLRVARAGEAGVELGDLARALGARTVEIEAITTSMIERGALRRVGGRLLGGDVWRETGRVALGRLDEFHRAEPLRAGVSREELRGRVAPGMAQEGWRALLDELRGSGSVELDDDLVALAGHRVVLSGVDRELADRIEKSFLDAGLDPPDVETVTRDADTARARRIVDHLVASGRLVRIHGGRLFHAEPLAELIRQLRDFARTSTTIDVASFKELAGVTRKNAIPLLEHLDARRLTRRVGNVRELVGLVPDADGAGR